MKRGGVHSEEPKILDVCFCIQKKGYEKWIPLHTSRENVKMSWMTEAENLPPSLVMITDQFLREQDRKKTEHV